MGALESEVSKTATHEHHQAVRDWYSCRLAALTLEGLYHGKGINLTALQRFHGEFWKADLKEGQAAFVAERAKLARDRAHATIIDICFESSGEERKQRPEEEVDEGGDEVADWVLVTHSASRPAPEKGILKALGAPKKTRTVRWDATLNAQAGEKDKQEWRKRIKKRRKHKDSQPV